MNTQEIIEKLRQCNLHKAVGLYFRLYPRKGAVDCFILDGGRKARLRLDSDKSAQSTLFIVRGLMALRSEGFVLSPHDENCFQLDLDGRLERDHIGQWQFFAPTMAQAVALALIAVFATDQPGS